MATVEAPPRLQVRLHKGPFVNEPYVDFSKEENARKMRDAIEKVRGQLGREYDLVIGGKHVKTNEKIRSLNPAKPSQVVGLHQKAGKDHVEPAMTDALKAFESWSRTSVEERASLLFRVGDLLRERKFEFMFAILIPVFAFLLVPTRLAVAGDTEAFLERASTIQWGLMICVYCLSYTPALLMLNIVGYGPSAKLMLYLVIVDQLSDVLQYVWGKLFGRHKIAPLVSPNKTWEGFVGGIVSATLVGTALWWMTPFRPLVAAGVSLVITLMGFAGGLTMPRQAAICGEPRGNVY